MIRDFLNRFEDPKMPLLAPNYWLLRKSGLILSERPLYKYLYLASHLFGLYFIISEYVDLISSLSEIDLVISNLMITMMSQMCFLKAHSCVYWQKEWKEIIRYVTEADKFERDNSDDTKSKIIDKYTTYSRKITYGYWCIVFSTVVSVCAAPLVHLIPTPSKKRIPRNETELFTPIFGSWMPFDQYRPPGSWITAIWHISICAYGGTGMAAYDSTTIVIMGFFECKLELLRQRCKEMLGSNDKGVSDEDADIVIRQLHDIHMKVLKYMRLFNSVFSPLMFLYMFNSTLMICTCAYQLTVITNAAQRLLLGEYLGFGIAQLFFICWHSNKVLIKMDSLSYGTFESSWYTSTPLQRQYILFLCGQLRIKHVFTAGPFTNLTLSTFITILKGAYSYYMLLRK
ncbi:odorant receptor 49b-like [Achroia grisella]|uniref:odorant receptor 49b-like n=1 Tax=Achroia grisella TaxID=688607 RepID=UPI0027D2EE80|nr:odorant receptor 49b-like [Achroia grisella]